MKYFRCASRFWFQSWKSGTSFFFIKSQLFTSRNSENSARHSPDQNKMLVIVPCSWFLVLCSVFLVPIGSGVCAVLYSSRLWTPIHGGQKIQDQRRSISRGSLGNQNPARTIAHSPPRVKATPNYWLKAIIKIRTHIHLQS